MNYPLVIFDFDGTLADSFPWFLTILNELAEKHSFRQIPAEELTSLRGLENRALLKHLQVPFWKLPLLARDMRKLARRDGEKFGLHAGVEPMLLGLKQQGKKIAIVTSNSEENVRKILGPELAAQVDCFQCGASLFGKARLLKKALRQLKARPSEAIYLGDETRDHEAASSAGMAFGFVTWGYATPEAFRERSPDYTFHKPEEILL
jgi:phosphoglycolate phosphatase